MCVALGRGKRRVEEVESCVAEPGTRPRQRGEMVAEAGKDVYEGREASQVQESCKRT
jgi:hypothetical protein